MLSSHVILTFLTYFPIYAFLGWCLEVIYASVNTGKFVNRGFLNGAVCPIYGFGQTTYPFYSWHQLRLQVSLNWLVAIC